MRRRTILVAAASALSAGCVSTGQGTGDGTPTDDTTPTDGTPTGGSTTTDGTPTDGGGQPFAGRPCPAFDDHADTHRCYHDAPDADLVLEPEPVVFDTPPQDGTVRSLTFTLRNRTEWTFRFNPYAWRLERETDDGWENVAPDVHPEPMTSVDPGAIATWEIADAPHPHPHSTQERTLYPIEPSLSPGTYAFAISGYYDAPDDATQSPPEGRTELIALVRVEEPISPGGSRVTPTEEAGSRVTPTEEAGSTTRDDDSTATTRETGD